MTFVSKTQINLKVFSISVVFETTMFRMSDAAQSGKVPGGRPTQAVQSHPVVTTIDLEHSFPTRKYHFLCASIDAKFAPGLTTVNGNDSIDHKLSRVSNWSSTLAYHAAQRLCIQPSGKASVKKTLYKEGHCGCMSVWKIEVYQQQKLNQ